MLSSGIFKRVHRSAPCHSGGLALKETRGACKRKLHKTRARAVFDEKHAIKLRYLPLTQAHQGLPVRADLDVIRDACTGSAFSLNPL